MVGVVSKVGVVSSNSVGLVTTSLPNIVLYLCYKLDTNLIKYVPVLMCPTSDYMYSSPSRYHGEFEQSQLRSAHRRTLIVSHWSCSSGDGLGLDKRGAGIAQ